VIFLAVQRDGGSTYSSLLNLQTLHTHTHTHTHGCKSCSPQNGGGSVSTRVIWLNCCNCCNC